MNLLMPELDESDSTKRTEREQRLEAVIADYIRGCEAGSPPDCDQLLDQHPDLADDLRQFFSQRDRIGRLVEPIRGFREDLLHSIGPGQHINYLGNYELLEEIARGGMGVVYKARQKTLGRIVAVKMMIIGRLANEDDIKRFQTEAEAAAALQHPNIVPIHEVGQHEGLHYFSMDFVEGRSLSAILHENPLPARQAATYVRQMAEAIHFAHQKGTLHRDLKPSNILIDDRDQVHITDFGLATRVEDDSELTRTGQILGTPSYMPPEQAQGKRSLIGPGSDVYSLGAILYECLTGRAPFRADSVMKTIEQVIQVEAPSPRLMNPAISRDLETICLKCLEKEPHQRYGTAQLLADDLGRYVKDEPIVARPANRMVRLGRWCRRSPLVAALTIATVLLMVTTTGVSVSAYLREADLRQASDGLRERAEKGEREARKTAVKLEKTVARLIQEQQERENGQTVIRELNRAITSLSEKRAQLVESVQDGERELSENLIKLARSEWQAGDVVRADQNLEKCPERWRGTEWHRLKRLWLPDATKFEGRSRVAFSPSGDQLAIVRDNFTVELWDLESQTLVHTLAGHRDAVAAVAFSRDGKLLASGGLDRTVRIWSLSDGNVVKVLEGHTHPVTDVTFSADDRFLASASFESNRNQQNGEVILWDRQTLQEMRRLPGRGRVAFAIEGQLITIDSLPSKSGSSDTTQVVQAWNIESVSDSLPASALTVPLLQSNLPPLALSSDGRLVAVVGAPTDPKDVASLQIWNLSSKKLQQRLPLDFHVHSLAFSPDSNRLACGGRNGFSEAVSTTFKAVTFNLITGERDRIFPWYQRTVTDLAFDRDGRRLATATSTEVRVWDVTSPSDPTQVILAGIPEHNVGPGDWPQWGGSRNRINTPMGRNIPIEWDVGVNDYLQFFRWFPESYNPRHVSQFERTTRRVGRIPQGSKNIKWAVPLGTQSYGNPVVANGRIFVGANNGAGYLPRFPSRIDLGVLLCFEEETGNFLWQHSNLKLPTGRVHDWPQQGVCSTPVIDGDRLWYVTNRGEVVCLDSEGFYDGEDDGQKSPAGATTEWSVLFRVPARFKYDIAGLLKAFNDAGVVGSKLPDFENLTEDKPQQSLLVGRHLLDRSDGSRKLHPSHELFFSEGLIQVYEVDSTGKRTYLLSRQDDLFPGLASAKIDDILRSTFLDYGVQLTGDSHLDVIQSGIEWSIDGVQFGKLRKFRLNLSDGRLTCSKQNLPDDLDEADVVWKFDMMGELGVHPHNMSNCSMITADGLLFVCTSNGVDESHTKLPAPNAPSFIALDRVTGRLVWKDNSPGTNVIHAQWASPSYGVFDGQPQVIFPGGDGWVYSFDPKGDGRGGSRLLWKLDANPKDSIYRLGGRATRNSIIAFPAIYDGLVYITVGEDPEHGEGPGRLWCIDPTKRMDGSDVSAELAVDSEGNIIPHRRLQAVDVKKGERAVPNPNSAVRWQYSSHDRDGNGKIDFKETFSRSLSIPVIKDDILYIADFAGLFHCLNAKTGKFYWNFDLFAACWSSALLVDGHVYICDEDGDVCIFRHSADPHIAMKTIYARDGRVSSFEPINYQPGATSTDPSQKEYNNMGNSIYMTPIVANNVLYIATRNTLYAIQSRPDNGPAPQPAR